MNAVFVFHFSVGVVAVDCVAVKQPLEGYSINIKKTSHLKTMHTIHYAYAVGMLTNTHTSTKNAFIFSSPNGIFSVCLFVIRNQVKMKLITMVTAMCGSPTSRYNIICLRIERIVFVLVEMSNDKFDAFFCPIHISQVFTWNSCDEIFM